MQISGDYQQLAANIMSANWRGACLSIGTPPFWRPPEVVGTVYFWPLEALEWKLRTIESSSNFGPLERVTSKHLTLKRRFEKFVLGLNCRRSCKRD